jgi:hypothetical protein
MFEAPVKVGIHANLSHLVAYGLKDVSPAVPGHSGCIAEAAAGMFFSNSGSLLILSSITESPTILVGQ